MQKFATGTAISGIVVQNVKSNASKTVHFEEAHTTLPTFDKGEIRNLQNCDTVISTFIEIWNSNVKTSRSQIQKLDKH